MKEQPIKRVIVELGIKPYTSYDQETIERVSYNAFKFWEHILRSAPETDVLLWIGDGDEVFNWRGDMNDEINYNTSVGFNNMDYGVYPESRHYKSYPPVDYIPNPPKLTYAILKRIVTCLREKARELLGREIGVGTIIDAGPEFVQSTFKYERHPEIIEGGPESQLPKSLGFLNCYAKMKADDYPYAEFPDGVPEGTSFGEFLGKQLKSMCAAVDIDYCWFSNGFGLTHYAWSYLGEVYDGRKWDVQAAPRIIDNFAGFWRDFRTHCPDLRIELRGTNYSIGQDSSAHGIDVRRVYSEGKVTLPAPNPPWGSMHLELEMASFMSRISWTPAERILFRFYMNDSWFLSQPWWCYYNREPFDIYCPMSIGRVNADASVDVATDLSLMTVNSGQGSLGRPEEAEGVEITPHYKRAFEYSPDAPGPVVWVYPFDEYQDLANEGSDELKKVFFQDWFVTRCIAGGMPLNTVVNTGNFRELMKAKPEALAQSVLFAPASIGASEHVAPLLDFVRSGGRAIVYGSLEDAPQELLDALNLKLGEPLDGELDVSATLPEATFTHAPGPRRLMHRSRISAGGVRAVVADAGNGDTQVRVAVSRDGAERAYCVSRSDRSWQGGRLAWIRGSLPFEAKPVSIEPIADDMGEYYDAGQWICGLLEEMGITVRQTRTDVNTPGAFTFIHRHDGAFVFSGHKPDVTVSVELGMPDGAPVLEGQEVQVQGGLARCVLGKSFNYQCRAFVRQEAESTVKHRELRTRRDENRHFRIEGLVDATVTVYPQPGYARAGKMELRRVNVYSIPDPTAEEELKKRRKTPDLPEEDLDYAVDEARGCVTVEHVTGALAVTW